MVPIFFHMECFLGNFFKILGPPFLKKTSGRTTLILALKQLDKKALFEKKNVFQMTFFRKVSDTFAIVLGSVENKKH